MRERTPSGALTGLALCLEALIVPLVDRVAAIVECDVTGLRRTRYGFRPSSDSQTQFSQIVFVQLNSPSSEVFTRSEGLRLLARASLRAYFILRPY